MGKKYILAIDQGTTSTGRSSLTRSSNPWPRHKKSLPSTFHNLAGWSMTRRFMVTTVAMCQQACERENVDPVDIAAIGITNQRETTIVWNRHTGRAIYNAIVWQDRRTADYCRSLKEAGHEPEVTRKTGLLIDPYFSATKLNWILENVDGARGSRCWRSFVWNS